MKVLIIDHSKYSQNVVSNILKKSIDVEVFTAENEVTALSILSEEFLDLLVFDFMLPGIDSFALLAKLRDLEKSIPIIVTSSELNYKTIKKLNTYDVTDILKSPASTAEMTKAISNIFSLTVK